MSIDPKKVAELLSGLYVERKDEQWRTVAHCIEELLFGKVTKLEEVAAAAFGFVEVGDDHYKNIANRARKLNNRIGSPGRLEVSELALAAVEIALSSRDYGKLLAHVSRIGFNKKIDGRLENAFLLSKTITRNNIKNLVKSIKKFTDISDQFQKDNVSSSLNERDKYYHDQIISSLNVTALVLACSSGQSCPWNAIDKLLSEHSYPYPYEYELLLAQSCFSGMAKNGLVDIFNMPPLPNNLHTSDIINFPALSIMSCDKNNEVSDNSMNNLFISVEDFSQQILLEILFLRTKVRE